MDFPLKNPAAPKRFANRLALFYGAIFACIGAYLPFFPVWLDASGFDPAGIGTVMAIPVFARLVAVPLVTRLADKRHVLRGAIVVTSLMTAAGFIAMGLVSGPAAIAIAFALTSAAWTPVLPLTDAFALRAVMQSGIKYGPIRLWGSAAFIAGSLTAGWLSAVIATVHLVWIVAAFAVLGLGASLLLGPIQHPDVAHHGAARPSTILRMPAFVMLLAGVALIQGSHAGYYTFSSMRWRDEGMSGMTISALWSVGVVAEIVLFALSPRLRVAPASLLAIGAVGAVVRWGLMASEPSAPVLWVAQLLHGVSFGATHLGAQGLMARLVPQGLTATAQGYLFTLTGASIALASIASGRIYASSPSAMYLLMAVVAMVGGIFILLMRRALHRAASPSV